MTPASTLICQNGASHDVVYDRCHCSPHYHGAACQFKFDKQTVLTDVSAAHRPGNRELCSSSTDSVSKAGNHLTEGCGPNPQLDCGSSAPFVVHELVREDTNSRSLFSGKAYRLHNFSKDTCYLSGNNQQTYFPIRKLICSADLTLYFLYPLASGQHYCIGEELDKPPSMPFKPRRASSPSGFAPNARKPTLEQRHKFICTVFGLLLQENWNRLHKFGKSRNIDKCTQLGRSFRGKANYDCPSQHIMESGTNIYGSNAVGRQRTIPSDGVDVSVVHWTRKGKAVDSKAANRGCEFPYFKRGKSGELCVDLMLQNRDPEGRVVFGLSSTEQLSLVKINISYSSSSPGISTYNRHKKKAQLELLETLELKIDLTTLPNKSNNYLHIFSDPFVKPANGSYNESSVYELTVLPGEAAVFDALLHKKLPYQVQILIQRPNSTHRVIDSTVTKRVAVRYGSYIIRVHSSAETDKLQYEIKKKMPGSNIETTISEDDLIGVTIEPRSDVVRIKFDYYGTIIYVWRFRTRFSNCTHGFVMSQRELQSLNCSGRVHKVGGEFVLDLMVVPGFFDTEGNIAGLMYSSSAGQAGINAGSSGSLFSSSYAMPEIKSHDSLFMPTEVLKLCSCNAEANADENCIASVRKVTRNKRFAPRSLEREAEVNLSNEKRGLSLSTQSPAAEEFDRSKKLISTAEAERSCREFVRIRSTEKRFSIEFCSSAVNAMAQFEFVCVRYAKTLQTFLFMESLFNSMLGMCQEGLMYNVTEIRVDNGTAASRLQEELCPNRCSGRGVCLSGSCVCTSGFFGADCAYEASNLSAIPIAISTPQQGPLCSSSDCLDISVQADSWNSSNRVRWLLYQSSCSEKPVKCTASGGNWSCITDGDCRQPITKWSSGLLFIVIVFPLLLAAVVAAALSVKRMKSLNRCSSSSQTCRSFTSLLKAQLGQLVAAQKATQLSKKGEPLIGLETLRA
uniref:EGF-like domain-containing protein n=1 Tax=Macrostomum lignano TaxID=282301 RepID=A0A1I8HKH7_9PLAT